MKVENIFKSFPLVRQLKMEKVRIKRSIKQKSARKLESLFYIVIIKLSIINYILNDAFCQPMKLRKQENQLMNKMNESKKKKNSEIFIAKCILFTSLNSMIEMLKYLL